MCMYSVTNVLYVFCDSFYFLYSTYKLQYLWLQPEDSLSRPVCIPETGVGYSHCTKKIVNVFYSYICNLAIVYGTVALCMASVRESLLQRFGPCITPPSKHANNNWLHGGVTEKCWLHKFIVSTLTVLLFCDVHINMLFCGFRAIQTNSALALLAM